jgi:formamidopyrimidine-DNA glycosylase
MLRSLVRRMPEGPEVAVLVDALASRYNSSDSGTTIATETVQKPFQCVPEWRLRNMAIVSGRYAKHGPPEGWERLQGLIDSGHTPKLKSVRCSGKFIYFLLECDYIPHLSLWSTLGLSGGWTLRPDHRHRRLSFTLGRNTSTTEQLYFYDSIGYGTFKVCFDEVAMQQKLDKLGPSWLDHAVSKGTTSKDTPTHIKGHTNAGGAGVGVSFHVFCALITKRGVPQQRRRLAVFLMDQTKTSGIGNYILAESLYRARLHPWARVGDLMDEQIRQLWSAICDVTTASYDSQLCRMRMRMEAAGRGQSTTQGGKAKSSCGGYGWSADIPEAQLHLFEFRLEVYKQKSDPLGNDVVAEKGPHGRTIHWVRELQTGATPTD